MLSTVDVYVVVVLDMCRHVYGGLLWCRLVMLDMIMYLKIEYCLFQSYILNWLWIMYFCKNVILGYCLIVTGKEMWYLFMNCRNIKNNKRKNKCPTLLSVFYKIHLAKRTRGIIRCLLDTVRKVTKVCRVLFHYTRKSDQALPSVFPLRSANLATWRPPGVPAGPYLVECLGPALSKQCDMAIFRVYHGSSDSVPSSSIIFFVPSVTRQTRLINLFQCSTCSSDIFLWIDKTKLVQVVSEMPMLRCTQS
jgi:hypothetical protein